MGRRAAPVHMIAAEIASLESRHGRDLDAMSPDALSGLAEQLPPFPREIFRRHGPGFVRGHLLLAMRDNAATQPALSVWSSEDADDE